MVGYQLQRIAPRSAGGGALEPAASGSGAPRSPHREDAGRRGRTDRRRNRLYQGGSRSACAVVAGAAEFAGDGRVRAQRKSRTFAALLRNFFGSDRAGGVIGAGAFGRDRRAARRRGDSRAGVRSGEARSLPGLISPGNASTSAHPYVSSFLWWSAARKVLRELSIPLRRVSPPAL